MGKITAGCMFPKLIQTVCYLWLLTYTNIFYYLKPCRLWWQHNITYRNKPPAPTPKSDNKPLAPPPPPPPYFSPPMETQVKIAVYFAWCGHLEYRLGWQTIPVRWWLLNKGIRAADTPQTADIILLRHDSQINEPAFRDKKKLLCSQEPFHSTINQKITRLDHSLLFTANMHTNPLSVESDYNWYPFYLHGLFPNETLAKLPFSTAASIKPIWNKRKKIMAFMSLKLYKHPLSLLNLRTKIALYGHALGMTDILGRDWPRRITQKVKNAAANGPPESPNKIICLRQNYLFNLCFENSKTPYYVTEKLWEAIVGYTLPIYYSNDTIYQIFPKDSFIDYRNFRNKQHLHQYILDMTMDAYLERLNRCIEVVRQEKKHLQAFADWQKKARQHIYANLTELYEMQ